MAVGVKDIALAAGVSLGTVSNVLNHPERVSARTRARVEQVMADVGFVPNESARQLRAGRSRTLAYVVLDVSNPFFTDVAKGVEETVSARDLSLFVCNSDNRADREKNYLNRLEEQRVAGVLLTPVDPESPLLDQISARGTPIVIVDRTRPGGTHCSVAVDDVLGGRLALEHLLDRGHERIAFIGGPATIGQVRDRHAGALAALADAGLDESNLLRIDTSTLSVSEGRQAAQRLAGIPGARRPTAAFCANDLLALGLLQQCVTTGVSVPGDLAIVGYDDIEYAGAAAVPLTSVRQPRLRLGRTAAELLLDEVENPDHAHQQITFTPELVARASTDRPPR
jgi:LacI family transcriptional regulator